MKYVDIEVEEVTGLDVEREDRSVGIFGNDFILCFKDNKDTQYQLILNDEQFQKLHDLVVEEGKRHFYDYECNENNKGDKQ